MTIFEWLIFFFVVQLIHGLGTWKLYIKSGYKGSLAFIPIYNAFILMKIINRPFWWVILLFLPIINLLIFPVIWVETARSFGKNSTADTIATVASFGFFIYLINYSSSSKYINERNLNPKTAFGEWLSSIIFAIILATLVHTYFIQPFIVPTGSLEKSILIGDFPNNSRYVYVSDVKTPTPFYFDNNGVDVCYEIHPGEDLHDGITFEMFLDEVKGHKRANLLYDPSHFVLQALDYKQYIDFYHERIKMFHVKDAEFNPTGKQGVYGGFQSWINRAGRFRSLGDGQVDFKSIFSKLTQYGYDGWAVLEWECCIKDPVQGATEGAPFIASHIIKATEKVFDDFAGTGADEEFNKKILGL